MILVVLGLLRTPNTRRHQPNASTPGASNEEKSINHFLFAHNILVYPGMNKRIICFFAKNPPAFNVITPANSTIRASKK
jgi:hypothetical protein